MSDSILYANNDRTTLVIDIPTSIALSQGGGRVYSQQAIAQPFKPPEPKGPKREEYLAKWPAQHLEWQHDLQIGIEFARKEAQPDQWCIPRTLSRHTNSVHTSTAGRWWSLPTSVVLSSLENNFRALTDIQHVLVFNENASTVHLTVQGQRMHVPPRSVFAWTSIERGIDLVQAKFELILMDPPWQNRSVRRASTYSTTEAQSRDPFEQALKFVDLARAEKGYAGIWITNKAAVREQVLQHMICRGYGLTEEWIWSKVTSQGEFVSPLDGVWRKPYEVLLIFRHAEAREVKHRYLFAVPDLHSRKPNLKSMFRDVLGVERVLELFARHVTAGWCCVGDQVTMFQDCVQWEDCPP